MADAESRDQVTLATAELVGALTYGQLRAFQVTADAVRLAPTIALADQLASFAVREHERYVALRDHLRSRTELADRVTERQREPFDAFFDQLAFDDWIAACAFFAMGLPIAADFVRAIAPAVDDETGQVLTAALADRAPFEQFALDQVKAALANAADEDVVRLRHLVANTIGRGLTGYQASVADTDALRVLLASDETNLDEGDVTNLAIEVLHAHRARMVALGLDDLE